MDRREWFSMQACLFVSGLMCGCSAVPGAAPQSASLITGENGLANFRQNGQTAWRAEGGAVLADAGPGGYLVSLRSFKDFYLVAEFWSEATTNSGVMLRCSNVNLINSTTSYEVNIFDARPDGYGTAAIVNVAKVLPTPKTAGQWNRIEITARGTHLIVVLNGVKTVDANDGRFTEGPIALQFAPAANGFGGGAIKWRKLVVDAF
jgi:hypothetical protein